MVGLPRQRSDPFCSNLAELDARYDLTHPGQLRTACRVDRLWQMLLAVEDLLQALPFLGIVSSRDIGNRVQANFAISEVKTYPVPPERRLPGDFESLSAQYPGRFNELFATLSVPYRSAVVLVGEGALGKFYADVIFQRRGIALDAGSVLDRWANVPSRGFLRQDPGDFALESYQTTASLEPAAKLDRHRRLLHQVFYGHAPTDEE